MESLQLCNSATYATIFSLSLLGGCLAGYFLRDGVGPYVGWRERSGRGGWAPFPDVALWMRDVGRSIFPGGVVGGVAGVAGVEQG